VLCQTRPPSRKAPETVAPPGAATVTLVTLPLVAVTVIPAEGLTPRLPLAGAILSSEASSAACAEAAAEAAEEEADAEAEAWAGVCGGPLLQAAVSSPIVTAATTLA
jgi:hypothetical protein